MTDASDPTSTAIDPSPEPEPVAVPAGSDEAGVDAVDLDAIERELDDVQAALDRLNDGTYWDDEISGEPIPDEVLAADPTARSTAPRSRP